MEAKEFINRIILFGFDKKAFDFYISKLNLSSDELSEIRLNSIVIQWYATQVYISARTSIDRLSGEEGILLNCMYNSLFVTPDFKLTENTDFKSKVLLKITQQKDHYYSVYTSNEPLDITGHPFIREIGVCFARLCGRSESIVYRRLGSELFGNCLNRCINEFKFERIEFKDLK
ncbi:MAG: hypothetical protein A2066_04150 [Bacteroidetes bacterium GWB2_41_8]|nr:MAG: hypothetical protein A2066_04150 [Bacteroidetes bacterium GWB2_41_8]